MSCDHKFKKYLELELLDFEPVTLIVGTFCPAWPKENTAEWFYGRTDKSSFWDVLPRLHGAPSLINATPAEWKVFCRSQKIAITDLISGIDDADPENKEQTKILAGGDDQAIAWNFDDFEFVNIVQLLKQYPTIKNVYLTRGVTEAFWRHLWNPVVQYCSLNNIRERKLLTPAPSAAYQHEKYNIDHPAEAIPLLEDYILMKWHQEWHNL